VPYVELDAIQHQAGWQPLAPEEFLARVTAIAAGDGWVVDGPVWARADTIVWLDLPRRTVMRQVTARTLRRGLRRQELWNGNRESLRSALAWDPYTSVIRWAWTRHATYRDRFASAMATPAVAHAAFVRLRSHAEADHWLAALPATTGDRPGAGGGGGGGDREGGPG
jgi:hypothetical protein